jgi:hypothetical protein
MTELIRPATALVLSIAGIVNLGLLLRAVVGRIRRGELDGAAMLTVFIVTATSVLLQTTFLINSNSIRAVFLILAVTACLGVTYRRGSRRGHNAVPIPGILGLLLWSWLYLADLIHDPGMSRTVILAATGAGCLWLSALLASARTGLPGFAFAASLGLTLSALIVPTPFLSTGWRQCDQYKCNVPGALFRGAFASENYLAMQTVFLALFALVYLTGTVRTGVLLLSMLVCVAAGSRTSLLVVLACLAIGRAFSGTRGAGHQSRRNGMHVFYGWLMFATAWLGMVVYLVESAPSNRFSDRGAIWQAGLRALHGHRILGLGMDRWSELQRYGELPNHYPHDVYLLFWFSGGVAALALFALWIATVLTRLTTSHTGAFPPAIIAVAFLLIGVTEVVWNPLTFDGLSWVAIAMSVVAGRAAGQHPEPAATRTPGTMMARAPMLHIDRGLPAR